MALLGTLSLAAFTLIASAASLLSPSQDLGTAAAPLRAGSPCDVITINNWAPVTFYYQLLLDCDGDGQWDTKDDLFLSPRVDEETPSITTVKLKYWVNCTIVGAVFVESHPLGSYPTEIPDATDPCLMHVI